MSEKHEILDAIDSVVTPDQELGIRFFALFLLVVCIVLALLFPKIYLQSQIYYKSRDIAHLKQEHNALLEENRIIKSKVEEIRFKNQILDTLFKLG
jgi:cell division protein FtsL